MCACMWYVSVFLMHTSRRTLMECDRQCSGLLPLEEVCEHVLSDSCGGDVAHPQSTVLRRHTEEGRERWRERWGEAEKEREKERERGLKILIPTTYIGRLTC